MALGLTPTAIRQGLETARPAVDAALYGNGDQRVIITSARNPSALAGWLEVLGTAFPGRRRTALLELPSDWRGEDAAEMGALLVEGFAAVTLVAPEGSSSVENLTRKIAHPALRRENAWQAALDRILGEAGPSDCIFVGPSKRASRDQANENCKKRNMARLD
jgi:hypothetical protein